MDANDPNKSFELIVANADAGNPPIPTRVRRQRDGFNRMDVVNAFQNAFEMIGGVPRLALWANQHPDKFFPLYAKLMPSTSLNISTEGNTLIIEHALPDNPLDDYTDLMGKFDPHAKEPIKDKDGD